MRLPIKVLLVDDHAMVRQGLSTFLNMHEDLEVVGTASGGKEALTIFAEYQPDVILMDLVMPDINGVDVIREILKQTTDIKIIALSSFGEKELVRAALEAGAAGYLLKDISGDELAAAIRKVHIGQPVLSNAATKALMESVTQSARVSPFELSVREREVLAFIVDGLSNAEIAYKMGVKQSTVKTYVSRILSKLDVASRVEAATLAVRYKLTE